MSFGMKTCPVRVFVRVRGVVVLVLSRASDVRGILRAVSHK